MTDMEAKAASTWKRSALQKSSRDAMKVIHEALTEAHREGMEAGKKDITEFQAGQYRNQGMEKAAKVADPDCPNDDCTRADCVKARKIAAAIREKINAK